jgi:NADPH:quinone reductase-like Zn-dependent oxidoreductase
MLPVPKIGTFSEFIDVEEQFVALKPKNLSHIEASFIPLEHWKDQPKC